MDCKHENIDTAVNYPTNPDEVQVICLDCKKFIGSPVEVIFELRQQLAAPEQALAGANVRKKREVMDVYWKRIVHDQIILIAGFKQRAEQAEAQAAVMREAIKEIAEAPYVIESATIPKAGIESAPEQVVGTLHIVLKRMLRIQAVAQAHDPASALLAEHKRYGEALERIAYSDWGVVLPEYQQIARAALNKEEPK